MARMPSRSRAANDERSIRMTGARAIRLLRAAVGGALMGAANLVPGLSGGTMLLVSGVYPDVIEALAGLTAGRWQRAGLILLGTVAAGAALVILLLAGPVKTLVVQQRWVMYSLFVGLTLGGVPLIWRLAQPRPPSFFVAGALACLLTALLAFGDPAQSGSGQDSGLLLFVAGLAGAGAMILPGVSGGYLLLLMGQYVPVLTGIEKLRAGLSGSDWPLLVEALGVVVPVGLGVVAGVVGVSRLLRWFLARSRSATLGALAGLVVGALAGLWPFQVGVAPQVGDVVRGRPVTAQRLAEIDPGDWPVRVFAPSGAQVGAGLLLFGLGIGATVGFDRLNRRLGAAA